MKIVLINPPVDRAIESHDLPDYPHLGLVYLASHLIHHGILCEMIDAKLQRIGFEKLIRIIKKEGYDTVGISAMTHEIQIAAKLAQAIKEVLPRAKTIIGGVHATALPRETLAEFPCFDFLVHGEGEFTLLELVNATAENIGFEDLAGIAFRHHQHVVVNPTREWIEDLDALPFPNYSKLPHGKEFHLITSRGCPFQCIFCMSPYGRKKVRYRSPQNVIDELKMVASYDPKVIKFNDENFGFNRPRAIEILELIRKNNLHKIKKVASLRVDDADYELLKKMKDAGFFYIDYGVETGNMEIMKIIKKGITRPQIEKAIKLTKDLGIKTGANYIIGHPGETLETARQTLEFAVKLNADVNAIGLMVPYPGTRVAEMARTGEGGYKLISMNWKDYNKQLGNALELRTLSRKQMERLQLIGYVKILLYNFRILDLFRFFWENRRSALAFSKKKIRNSIRMS